ncbi:hypothetical protein [Massilia sp. DD77]|uniref:hypothetical protein n=1 Tax=Massilia sp. DD77 TaxID=3109349 RepID=UPI002FFDA168
MLYHYASTDALRELHSAVTKLIEGVVDPLLELSRLQGRDDVLRNPRWGERDTSESWSRNAWPFLKDLQQSVAKDIGLRSFNQYRRTSTDECLRGADQYSMLWTSDDEEARYQAAVNLISRIAGPIDDTLDDHESGRWSDSAFMFYHRDFCALHPTRHLYRVRRDIYADSGELPPRTGVYVSADDPHASLQFAWINGRGCKLRLAKTFNEIGLAALDYVGRSNLWTDVEKMYEFATLPSFAELFRNRVEVNGVTYPEFAPGAVSRSAYVQKPSKWYFVEIDGEATIPSEPAWEAPGKTETVLRLQAGEVCKVGGYYYTPSRQPSRRFIAAGEIAPRFDVDFGETIWQWHRQQ